MTKKLIGLFVLLSIAAMLICQISQSNKKKRILNNLKISTGYITSCKYSSNRGGNFEVTFEFIEKNKKYKGSSTIRGIHIGDFKRHFISKQFPVFYESNKVSNNEILITPDRFKRFHKEFPDSLLWVKQYWTKDYIRFD